MSTYHLEGTEVITIGPAGQVLAAFGQTGDAWAQKDVGDHNDLWLHCDIAFTPEALAAWTYSDVSTSFGATSGDFCDIAKEYTPFPFAVMGGIYIGANDGSISGLAFGAPFMGLSGFDTWTDPPSANIWNQLDLHVNDNGDAAGYVNGGSAVLTGHYAPQAGIVPNTIRVGLFQESIGAFNPNADATQVYLKNIKAGIGPGDDSLFARYPPVSGVSFTDTEGVMHIVDDPFP